MADMAREMTPQERAESLLERMGLCGHPADSQFMGDIIEHDKQTRRAALMEAVEVVRGEMWDDYAKARLIVIAKELTRLAQEG